MFLCFFRTIQHFPFITAQPGQWVLLKWPPDTGHTIGVETSSVWHVLSSDWNSLSGWRMWSDYGICVCLQHHTHKGYIYIYTEHICITKHHCLVISNIKTNQNISETLMVPANMPIVQANMEMNHAYLELKNAQSKAGMISAMVCHP